MRKIIPVINFLLLYLVASPIFLKIDLYEQLFSDVIGPVYFLTVVLFGPISIVYAFYLYKKEDDKNLKFAMCLMTFGLIPFYLIFSLFWLILISFSNAYQASQDVFVLATICMSFVLCTNAFYAFNYARLKNRSLFYKISPFIFVVNVISLIMMLISEKRQQRDN